MRLLPKVFALIAIALIICSATIYAQQEESDPAEQAKMMQEYAKLAAPGEEHKLLEQLSGTWELTSKMFMAPGQEPLVATGPSYNEMILGGRFLRTYAETSGGGMDADVLTILGYDKRNNVYTLVSFDTFGTYYITGQGTYDSTKNELVLSGEDFDPIAGFTQIYDFVYDFSDEDKIIMEVIFKNPELTHGLDEYRMVEVTYTRSGEN